MTQPISASQHNWPAFSLSALALASVFALAACGGSSDDNSTPPVASNACAVITSGGSVVVGSGLPGDPAAPEPSSGYRTGMTAVNAKDYMVVTANPLASQAGCDVLKAGGNAMDAAVAVQMVLGLVEPQSSGIGGGAFMLYYDAKTQKVTAYDGRETAPAAATENYLRYIDDSSAQTTPLPSARASGRSIGTPGVVRMLDMAHQEHGDKAWRDLFQPAIDLANNGFRISGRMAGALDGSKADLARDPDAAALYLDANGNGLALGSTFKNPAYANTLQTIARNGADAFYTGDIARAIVNKVGMSQSAVDSTPITPGKTTLDDLANYQAKKREAVCTTYRTRYMICGMPPPSSGGITVASIMGILENFNLSSQAPTALDIYGGKPTVQATHWISEAGRLAYADRDKYIADTDFVPLPGGNWNAMLDKTYLASRAALIGNNSMGTAQAGDFDVTPLAVADIKEAGTTHYSIVDKEGNVVTMTTTVEGGMGSFHVTNGFVLNNQLTDFSTAPTDDKGIPIANRVEANKRPRSSMAPTLVFDLQANGSIGDLRMATGSPGGATIIQYVAKTLVGVLDWNMDAQQATNLINFGAANSRNTNIGGEHPNVQIANNGDQDALVLGLRERGHTVNLNAQTSGISTIVRVNGGWQGGADPRREGIVLGDNQGR